MAFLLRSRAGLAGLPPDAELITALWRSTLEPAEEGPPTFLAMLQSTALWEDGRAVRGSRGSARPAFREKVRRAKAVSSPAP